MVQVEPAHPLAPECGHFMQTDKPQVIVDAIERMVSRLRGGA